MNVRQFIPLLLVAAGIWAYHDSFQGPFIYDDLPSITENPHIRHLLSLDDALAVAPDLPVQGRPVVSLTLALNYALDELNVWGYHAFNLLVHLASALLLFEILRRTFGGEKLRDRFGNSAIWLAAAIALVWEVHPLLTESVTYVTQRSELLMGFFLLLTLYCTLRASESARPRSWQLAAILACALGMGSKEVMVGAPLLVLLYDRMFLSPSFRELWRRRAGLYAGLFATWLPLAALVARSQNHATGFAFKDLTPWDYLKTEAGVIVYYLRLSCWPRPLVIDYYDWPVAHSLPDCLIPGLVIIGLLSAAAWAFRRRPELGFLGAWFFIILAPTSSFLPSFGEAAAERRMYLPLAAVITLTLTGLFFLLKRPLREPRAFTFGCAAAASLAVVLSLLTIERNRDYSSAFSIWQDAVAKRPHNPRARVNLGTEFIRVGRFREALDQCDAALQLNPAFAEAHNNRGVALLGLGRASEAVAEYEQTLQFLPDYAEARNNLGDALFGLGRPAGAVAQFQAALRLKPAFAEPYNGLGCVFLQAGDLPRALGCFQTALQIKPDYALAHFQLGNALKRAGRLPEAIAQFEQAVRDKPDYPEAQNNLGSALLQIGRAPQAAGLFEAALRVKPDDAEAHNNLGNALLQLGNATDAAGQFEAALEINPGFAEAHNNLGNCRLQAGNTPDAITHFEAALRIKPAFAEAHNSLGYALLQSGQAAEAVPHFEVALKIKPAYAYAEFNLGNALEQLGRLPEALTHWERALQLKPDFAQAQASLARARAGK